MTELTRDPAIHIYKRLEWELQILFEYKCIFPGLHIYKIQGIHIRY
jgi:hypothetical protein